MASPGVPMVSLWRQVGSWEIPLEEGARFWMPPDPGCAGHALMHADAELKSYVERTHAAGLKPCTTRIAGLKAPTLVRGAASSRLAACPQRRRASLLRHYLPCITTCPTLAWHHYLPCITTCPELRPVQRPCVDAVWILCGQALSSARPRRAPAPLPSVRWSSRERPTRGPSTGRARSIQGTLAQPLRWPLRWPCWLLAGPSWPYA